MRVRRLIILAIVAAMAMVAQLALIPAAGAAPKQQRFTQDFTIAKGQCEALGDLTITGTAEFRTVTNGRTFNAVATGTATDDAKPQGTYHFNYHNHQTITPLPGGGSQVLMSDHFNLQGTGAASGLHLGFTWRITFDANGDVVAVEQLSTRGESVDPGTLESICDPI